MNDKANRKKIFASCIFAILSLVMAIVLFNTSFVYTALIPTGIVAYLMSRVIKSEDAKIQLEYFDERRRANPNSMSRHYRANATVFDVEKEITLRENTSDASGFESRTTTFPDDYEVVPGTMKRCPICNIDYPPQSDFCNDCGAKLTTYDE